jgi:predicted NUDIX family phosphoesterase
MQKERNLYIQTQIVRDDFLRWKLNTTAPFYPFTSNEEIEHFNQMVINYHQVKFREERSENCLRLVSFCVVINDDCQILVHKRNNPASGVVLEKAWSIGIGGAAIPLDETVQENAFREFIQETVLTRNKRRVNLEQLTKNHNYNVNSLLSLASFFPVGVIAKNGANLGVCYVVRPHKGVFIGMKTGKNEETEEYEYVSLEKLQQQFLERNFDDWSPIFVKSYLSRLLK